MTEPKPPEGGPCKPPAISFGTFALSLAQSALAEIQHAAGKDLAQARQHLDMARGSIDVLEMLECKTRGNLSEEEAQILSALLYEVRMAWLAASRSRPPGA
jgi:hypothetical protein